MTLPTITPWRDLRPGDLAWDPGDGDLLTGRYAPLLLAASQIPFAFGPTYTPAEPPRPCDAVYVKGKRAIVTHVDDSRDNPRGDVVLCVTWCDSGRNGVVFWAEVDGGVFRH